MDFETKCKILSAFPVEGTVISCEPYGNGHINDTYCVKTTEKMYILQGINETVFQNVDGLMDNAVAVTNFIAERMRAEGKDTSATLRVIPTKTGAAYHRAENGAFRLLNFIPNSVGYDKATPELFYRAGFAFGDFDAKLADFPAETLFETIPAFHNTENRYQQFMRAARSDIFWRLSEVGYEFSFIADRHDFCGILERAHKDGKLPLRVTHNDTKLNNILFDLDTGEPLSVIDLDTVMPGYVVCDFGDAIRFGAATAAEDETDLSKVDIDLNMYQSFLRGFLKGTAGALTETEIDLLPEAAILMTFECGMRFLTDYLSGDVYFKIRYPAHNLDRARNQFALVEKMEAALPKMKKILEEERQ